MRTKPNLALWYAGAIRRPSAYVPWYLSGGVSSSNCVAAYAPIGAASLEASYINLANPGTYNAAPGVAPTWDAANGWKNGGIGWLDTGVTPNTTYTAIVRYSNYNLGSGGYLLGQYNPPNLFVLHGGGVRYGNSSLLIVAPGMESGVLAVAGQTGYRNGVADPGTMTATAHTAATIYIFGYHLYGGSVQSVCNAYIQALSIYNATLTDAQVLAVTNAMNALGSVGGASIEQPIEVIAPPQESEPITEPAKRSINWNWVKTRAIAVLGAGAAIAAYLKLFW